ncbi:hypothetical protein [Agrobacterium bohemicum]|uniref:hypothetical protein n=1 Tax=Agrobacterium bohemicum TaxID=2052828 RepID=UPI000CCC1DA4|nr:hypothetical protein [Agrobacterium bohemicum]
MMRTDVTELAGNGAETQYCRPGGKGRTLNTSDRLSGKARPSPSGTKSAVAKGSLAGNNRRTGR